MAGTASWATGVMTPIRSRKKPSGLTVTMSPSSLATPTAERMACIVSACRWVLPIGNEYETPTPA